jgi:effector-binding domain-containing protein
VLHTGPYAELSEAYDVLRSFARGNRLILAGPYWEYYGHWNNDPTKLETTVSYLVD